MSDDGYATLTCPHCAKRLRANLAEAGQLVRCPHPGCGLAVPVPFSLDEDDEPEEAVLLLEDPAHPQQVPLATAPVGPRAKLASPPSPKPRQKPREEEEEDEPSSQLVLLPWALTAAGLLLAAGVVLGWTVAETRIRSADDSADRIAALEASNRDLRTENQKLRDRLPAPKTAAAAPAPKAPDVPAIVLAEIRYDQLSELIEVGQLRSLTLLGGDRVEGEVRDPAFQGVQGMGLGTSGRFAANLPPGTDPAAFVGRVLRADARYRAARVRAGRDEPEPVKIVRRDLPGKAPAPADPKPPEGREAFVGKWEVVDPNLQRLMAEVTFELRADGACALVIRSGGGMQEQSGTWKWDGRRLHVELNGIPGGMPAEIKWNGPDEFVTVRDNMPATFRRKKP